MAVVSEPKFAKSWAAPRRRPRANRRLRLIANLIEKVRGFYAHIAAILESR